MANKTDLKSKTTEELAALLATEQETVRKLNFSKGMTQMKDVKQGRTSKKLIAQLKTLLASRA